MQLQVKAEGDEVPSSPYEGAAAVRQELEAEEPLVAEALLRVDVGPEPERLCLAPPAVLLDCLPPLVARRLEVEDQARAKDVAVPPRRSCRLGPRRQQPFHRCRPPGREDSVAWASRLWQASSAESCSTSGSTHRRSPRRLLRRRSRPE